MKMAPWTLTVSITLAQVFLGSAISVKVTAKRNFAATVTKSGHFWVSKVRGDEAADAPAPAPNQAYAPSPSGLPPALLPLLPSEALELKFIIDNYNYIDLERSACLVNNDGEVLQEKGPNAGDVLKKAVQASVMDMIKEWILSSPPQQWWNIRTPPLQPKLTLRLK